MRVDVAELKQSAGNHKTIPVEFAVEPVEIGGQSVEFDRPFKGEAEIWNVGDRLLVRGTLSGEAQLPCSRCLTSFSLPVESSFEEEFIEGQPGSNAEADEAESDRTVSYYTGNEIDLSETLRDNVLLELPMKALCREDCEGICPTCGINLNEGSCSCVETTSVDPRLAALEKLLRKPDSNS